MLFLIRSFFIFLFLTGLLSITRAQDQRHRTLFPDLNKIILLSESTNIKSENSGKIFIERSSQRSIIKTMPIEFGLNNPEPFLAFGVYWNRDIDITDFKLEYSVSNNNEEWEDYSVLPEDDDFDGSNGFEYSSGLVLVAAEKKFVRFRVSGIGSESKSLLSEIKLHIINPGKSDLISIEKVLPENVQDNFQKPPVVSRTEWGCPQGQNSGWGPSYTTVTHLIIHHSAGPNVSSDWAAIVRSYWDLHTYGNGWGDIGYNYLVDPNGILYEGRAGGDNVIGAHFCGYNANTMGLCVMGTYTTVSPTDNALNSLKLLFAWKLNQRGIDPTASSYHPSSQRTIKHVSGHRDGCSTECPGTNLYYKLGNLRLELKEILASNAPVITATTPEPEFQQFPAYKSISISFSQTMDTASVRSALWINPPSLYTLKWTQNKNLEIKPSNMWQFSTGYSLLIGESAVNIFGAPLDGDGDGNPGGNYQMEFYTVDPDINPPFLLRYFPSGNGIDSLAEMKYIFNEEIDGLIGRVFFYNENGQSLPYNDAQIINENYRSIVTFKPVQPMLSGKQYKVVFKAGIKDYYGNAISDIEIPFITSLLTIREGSILENFEDQGGWSFSGSGVDTSESSFVLSQTRKIGGSYSGLLKYKFDGTAGSKIDLITDNTVFLSDSSDLGFWINGDLSHNQLSIIFSDDNVINFSSVDFFGWKYFEIPAAMVPEANGIKGFRVQFNDTGDASGRLYFDNIFTPGIISGIAHDPGIPEFYIQSKNYPNPFNPLTNIMIETNKTSFIKVEVFSVIGQKVAELYQGNMNSGAKVLKFRPEREMSSGIYFIRVEGIEIGTGVKKVEYIKTMFLK
ncbi:MAG: N-acetylmuramoyl-L-alanine amidase [Ignavibacteriales bacterium]|nr:N-acetylmuramoyl-L-alanine amidase [Ignavibacteriales bacterium]MCF8435668.1 N-acetylmuramoyl-L-alanine amidase [Ignavibacteriales bacterium]